MSEINGYLDSKRRMLLRRIVVKACDAINASSARLAMRPSENLDEHPNAWWREHDKKLMRSLASIQSDFDEYSRTKERTDR